MCNNHAGHGFYQISAELIYNSARHYGFEGIEVYYCPSLFPGQELVQIPIAFKVCDPGLIGERVGLVNVLPVGISSFGFKKLEITNIKALPIQSDYKKVSDKGNTYTRKQTTFLRRILYGIKQYIMRSLLMSPFYKIIYMSLNRYK